MKAVAEVSLWGHTHGTIVCLDRRGCPGGTALYTAEQVQLAVAAERERCARACEGREHERVTATANAKQYVVDQAVMRNAIRDDEAEECAAKLRNLPPINLEDIR